MFEVLVATYVLAGSLVYLLCTRGSAPAKGATKWGLTWRFFRFTLIWLPWVLWILLAMGCERLIKKWRDEGSVR